MRRIRKLQYWLAEGGIPMFRVEVANGPELTKSEIRFFRDKVLGIVGEIEGVKNTETNPTTTQETETRIETTETTTKKIFERSLSGYAKERAVQALALGSALVAAVLVIKFLGGIC